MDNASYLEVALRLANADLGDVAGAAAALREEPWWSERLSEADLPALREVTAGLRRVMAAAVDGSPTRVLHEVNSLLAAHPLRPRLSAGHDNADPHWHVHVADPDEPPATEVAAAASWGIAQGIVRHALNRFGHCAADDCANYFLDTSTNQAKRFCSPRCANRVHVAAFRSRRRD